jgi:hypothetical protein
MGIPTVGCSGIYHRCDDTTSRSAVIESESANPRYHNVFNDGDFGPEYLRSVNLEGSTVFMVSLFFTSV